MTTFVYRQRDARAGFGDRGGTSRLRASKPVSVSIAHEMDAFVRPRFPGVKPWGEARRASKGSFEHGSKAPKFDHDEPVALECSTEVREICIGRAL